MQYFPSGTFGLEEDYETTVDAFIHYFTALKDDGILFVQIFRIPPPRYEIRLFNNLREALHAYNLWPIDEYLIIFCTWDTVSFMLKKNGYSRSELSQIASFLNKRMFQPVFPKKIAKNEFIKGGAEQDVMYQAWSYNYLKLLKKYPFDVSVTTDERPFFHYFLKLSKVTDVYKMTNKGYAYFIHEGMFLPFLFLILVFLTFVYITPVLAQKKWKIPNPAEIVLYFSSIALGFMFLEVFFVHRLILAYTSPVDSFSTVVVSLLLSAGLGSLISPYLRERRLVPVMSIFLGLLFCIYFFLYLRDKVILLPLMGFFMGLFFPTGMRILCENNPELLPFAYAINGATSVIAPPLGSLLALSFGLSILVSASIFCYGLAIIIIARRIFKPFPNPCL